MNFSKLVETVLNENMTAGGASSVFGANVVNTAKEFSGDNIAKGDARNVYGGQPGILTRRGMLKTQKNKRRSKKKKR